jgi:hypothetical protein
MRPPSSAILNETPTGIYWYDDGILHVITKRGPEPPLEERKKQTETLISNLRGKKICAIIDITNSTPTDSESREYNARILPEIFCAIAFIATNPLGKILVNIYLGFKPLSFPHKVFSNIEDAREWIMQYNKNKQ